MEFPPLEFDHYSVAPEMMRLKNTGSHFYFIQIMFLLLQGRAGNYF